jgi:hypothetical protein
VTAGPDESREIFQSNLISEDSISEALDDIMIVYIQYPALISLLTPVGEGGTLHLLPGTEKQILLAIRNESHHGAASSGEYRFSTGGIDFGIDTVITGEAGVDEPIYLYLSVPFVDTVVIAKFELTRIPIDLNSGKPAEVVDTSVEFMIELHLELLGSLQVVTDLDRRGDSIEIELNEMTRLFSVYLKNASHEIMGPIRVINFPVPIGGPGVISGDLSIVDLSNTGFRANGEFITVADDSSNLVNNRFIDTEIEVGDSLVLEYVITFSDRPDYSIGASYRPSLMSAEFISGPAQGTSPRISTNNTGATVYLNFGESPDGPETNFIVQNNPFNPNDGPVRFLYNLDSESDVEFRIYTVTGEEVYSKTYLSGTEGGKAGTNQIQWDGRNSEGEMVLNGVYVTMLNVISTGEKASLKLAVLK